MSDSADGWKPIETAPKDGRLIRLTWMGDGKPQDQAIMRWDGNMKNGLKPGVIGFWVTFDKSMTWGETPYGGPTHWCHFVQ